MSCALECARTVYKRKKAPRIKRSPPPGQRLRWATSQLARTEEELQRAKQELERLEAENAAALRSVSELQRESLAIDLERGNRGFLRRVFASGDLDKRERHIVEHRERTEPLLQRFNDLRRRISSRARDGAEAEKTAQEKEESRSGLFSREQGRKPGPSRLLFSGDSPNK